MQRLLSKAEHLVTLRAFDELEAALLTIAILEHFLEGRLLVAVKILQT